MGEVTPLFPDRKAAELKRDETFAPRPTFLGGERRSKSSEQNLSARLRDLLDLLYANRDAGA